MICLIYDGYGASTATLVFITCIWVPFVRFKNALFKITSIIMMSLHLQRRHDHDSNHGHNDICWNVFPNIHHLPTLSFHDGVFKGDGGADGKMMDDICSICLFEFGDEDQVSQLGPCHHVFHKSCIVRWLDHGHFTCPLCRSNLLNVSCKYTL
ncbi:hypothetical protein QVD17_07887 [Tagetes erecta]|uniref:RING-type domain-containing protein n=1 Tax=Tagetes erecta TaxID=13708 RepID=A0AAD8KYS4_TARER|nr:hypothetical protein QVD17_07887 [Tagetes erecta]